MLGGMEIIHFQKPFVYIVYIYKKYAAKEFITDYMIDFPETGQKTSKRAFYDAYRQAIT